MIEVHCIRHEKPGELFLMVNEEVIKTFIFSLSSSPRIRSAPQSRLFAAMCLIKLIVSSESLGFLA